MAIVITGVENLRNAKSANCSADTIQMCAVW